MESMLLVFGFLILLLILVGISIASTAFWIWMVVDASQRKYKKKDEKILWLLIVILFGFIGAIVYYFVKRKNK